MINCDYTNNTEYTFYQNCCEQNHNIGVVGVYPEDKLERVLSCGATTDKWVEFLVPDTVDIPDEKPEIEEVVSIHSCIEIISQRVIKTPIVTGYTTSTGEVVAGENVSNSECTKLTGRKLIIEGILKQKIIYIAAVPEQTLHSASFIIPFSVFIIVDSNTPLSQSYRIYSYIEDIFVCKLSTRSIFKNTTIFIKAVALC